MMNYKEMYLILVRGIVEAMEALPSCQENCAAAERLTTALREAEEVYIGSEEE